MQLITSGKIVADCRCEYWVGAKTFAVDNVILLGFRVKFVRRIGGDPSFWKRN